MDQSSSLIKLSLLGSWQLHHQANPRAKAPHRKEQGLLAYLAVEAEQPHSRDSLIGLFWPELPAADARNNLRVTLFRLKPYLAGMTKSELCTIMTSMMGNTASSVLALKSSNQSS